MKILYLEPFYGGSHKDFALGFKKHSQHDVDLVTLPDRFWKWRMRGAALQFLEQIPDLDDYDAVFATDMMDLTDFIGLAKKEVPPILIYFHENQLSYPLSPRQKQDFHLGFTNIISAAAADRVMFNSSFQLNAFADEARKLIKQLPDFRPAGLIEEILKKSEVAYPGCRFEPGKMSMDEKGEQPPLIIWNHRWEHDKNPHDFFEALAILDKEDIPFSLAVLGESYENYPSIFEDARKKYGDRIKAFGFADSRDTYVSWLKKGAIVVSCAIQENFGISVVEAVRYGCLPLLPDRLSYPELIPEKHHHSVIYRTKNELVEKLREMLVNFDQYRPLYTELSTHMEQFSWCIRVDQYDRALTNIQKTS